jgi:uncharacterized protein YkwD
MTSSLRPALAAALLAATLAGCAGFGGGVVVPDARLAPQKAPGAQAAALISAHRRAQNLPPLVVDARLQRIAERQALAMARADSMSHTVDGSLGSRLADAPHSVGSENISAGYESLTRAIEGWKVSPGHNRNMLSPNIRRIGIAAADAPGSRYRVYWALVMTD